MRTFTAFAVLFAAFLGTPGSLRAQSEDGSVPLGDLARSIRRNKAEAANKPAPTTPVINNENINQVTDDVAKRKTTGTFSYSIDKSGDTFQVSSPDVTCSLSFNSKATALLSNPFASQELPQNQLARLEGPAVINGDTLQITVYNGSGWELREITVGLTVLRHPVARVAPVVGPMLVPAAATTIDSQPDLLTPEAPVPEEKPSDVTVLYKLKGAAPPSATTVFQQPLYAPLAPGDEWHWAIVEAKGVPPATPADVLGATPTLGAATLPVAVSPSK